MTTHEIVKKLIGKITPVGETNIDNKRYENLKEYLNLIESLIFDINNLIPYKDKVEFSMKRVGEKADEWIKEMGID